MLTVNSDKKAYASTLTSARFVVSVNWFYEGVKYRLNRVLLHVLSSIVSYFLVGVLKKQRKKIEKRMKDFNRGALTASDYKTLKKYLNSFDELLPTMNKVQFYDLRDVPHGMTSLVTEMKRTTSVILRYKDWLNGRLNRLNKEQFPTSQTNFRFISEKEISQKRSDVYEYWL